MEDYDAVYEFLESHQYPPGYTNNQKRSLRRKAQEHFEARNGILYYSKEPAGSQAVREWKHVPHSLMDKERILKSCHDNNAQGGHFGRDKTLSKIAERFYWKTMWKDVEEYVRTCPTCQMTNDAKFQKAPAPLHPIAVKSKAWHQVGVDLIGPLPKTSMGNRYIITLVDFFSKWPETAPLPDKSAICVAKFLFQMMCQHGCTRIAITDQGREFVNKINQHLFSLTNTEHRVSSAYHPQTNGLVERFNQTLQKSLVKLVDENQSNWDELLDGMLFSYRSAKQKSSGHSPFELMYCRKPILPIEMELDVLEMNGSVSSDEKAVEEHCKKMTALKEKVFNSAEENIKCAQIRYKRDYDNKHAGRRKEYTPGTLVIIRNSARDAIKGQKMGKRWRGLYKVVEHKGKGVYKVESVKTGKILKKAFNACRLKEWRVHNLSKPQRKCKPPPKSTPALVEGSIYQYASEDESVAVSSSPPNPFLVPPPSDSLSVPAQGPITPPQCSAPPSLPNSFLVPPPSDSLSVPAQGPITPLRCSTPVCSQQRNSPGNPLSVSSGSDKSALLSFWLKDLTLTNQDREALVNGKWLSDKHVNAANKLLQSQYPTINGLQDTVVLAAASKYRSGAKNFVQIMNIAQSHWICASNILTPPGVVEVYDSMPSYSAHSSALMRQVATVLQTPQAEFELRHVDVQRQVGGLDCGLFAVAFATALCSGIDPFTCSFKQTEMRSHLLTCFESHQLSTFPAPDCPRRLAHCRVLSTKRVPVYCVCRLPWNKYDKKRGPLVKCHSCKLWFHQFCLNIGNDIIVNKSAKLFCDSCHFDLIFIPSYFFIVKYIANY